MTGKKRPSAYDPNTPQAQAQNKYFWESRARWLSGEDARAENRAAEQLRAQLRTQQLLERFMQSPASKQAQLADKMIPPLQRMILKLTNEEFPDGWEDVPFPIRFQRVGAKIKASEKTFRRAYDRIKK